MSDVDKNESIEIPSGKKRVARKKITQDEISNIARQLITYFNSDDAHAPDSLNHLPAGDLAKVFKKVAAQWVGTAKEGKAELLIDLLKDGLKGKTWCQAYAVAIDLAGKLKSGEKQKTGLLAIVLKHYSKDVGSIREFTGLLGHRAGDLYSGLIGEWADHVDGFSIGENEIEAWVTGSQLLLQKKVGGKQSGSTISEENADRILAAAARIDEKEKSPEIPPNLYTLLPVLLLYASETGRREFSRLKLGQRIAQGPDAAAVATDVDSVPATTRESLQIPTEFGKECLQGFFDSIVSTFEKADAIPEMKDRIVHLEGRLKEAEMGWHSTEEALRSSDAQAGRLEAELASTKQAMKSEVGNLTVKLNAEESAHQETLKELDVCHHQKETFSEHYRQQFSSDIAKILERDGHAAWQRVLKLGADGEALKINLKNLLKYVSKAAGLPSPAETGAGGGVVPAFAIPPADEQKDGQE